MNSAPTSLGRTNSQYTCDMNDPADNPGKQPASHDEGPASVPDHPALTQGDGEDASRKVQRWLVQATNRQGEQVEREYDAGSREEAILAARTEGLRPIDAINRTAVRRRAMIAVTVALLLLVAIVYVTRDGFARRAFIQQRQAELEAEAQAATLPSAPASQGEAVEDSSPPPANADWTLATLQANLPESQGWQWTVTQGNAGGQVQLISHPDLPYLTARAKLADQRVNEFWIAAQMPADTATHDDLLAEVKTRISETVSIAAMVAGAERGPTLEWAGQLLAQYAAGQTNTESDSRRVNQYVMQMALTEGQDGVLFVAGVTTPSDDATP